MSILESSRRLAKNIKSAARIREIILVFAKHGFQDILEHSSIGRKILDRLSFNWFSRQEHLSNLSVSERICMSFEQLGPTFVKLGQLLSTRPDLIPHEWTEDLKKLQNQVQPVDFEAIETSLTDHFGSLEDIFISFNKTPIASASMSQVYSATLKENHQEVVVKVRRPDILECITKDLNALYALALLLEKYVPESRIYNPTGIVDEFFKTIQLEANFMVEANNIVKFQKNFKDNLTVKIPKVFLDLSGEQILVMEKLKGFPLSHKDSLKQEGIDPHVFLKRSVKMFSKMVFRDSFFHGDLHAGNIFVLPDNRIGIVDFGLVGRLNKHTKQSITNICIVFSI